jgi:hypothetical protein
MVLTEPDVTVRCLAGHAVPQRLVVVRLSTLNNGPGIGRPGCLLGLGGRRITASGLGPVAQLPETVFHRLHYLHAMGMRPLVLDHGLQGLRVEGPDAMGQAALRQVVVVGYRQLRSGRHCDRIPVVPRRKPSSPPSDGAADGGGEGSVSV